MSQVTTLHWPQAVMLKSVSNIRCNTPYWPLLQFFNFLCLPVMLEMLSVTSGLDITRFKTGELRGAAWRTGGGGMPREPTSKQ